VSPIKRNIGWLLLSQGATWIVSILTLLLVPNELGDELFGEISFAAVYVSFFGLVAGYGTNEFLTKTLSRATLDTGHYLYNTLIMKLIASLSCAALAVGIGVALGFDRQRTALVIVFCIGLVFGTLNGVLLGGYHALQRMGRPALLNAISLYVGALAGITILLTGGSVVSYALAFNLAFAIPLVGNFIGMLPELRTSSGVDRRVWTHVITGSFPFFVLSGLLLIYGSVDIVMLEVMAGTDVVGWYTLAYRWVGLPAFFAVVVSTAFFPALSAEGVAVSGSFKAMANRAMFVVIAVTVPAAIGIGLVADDFISLVYGEDFRQVVPIMQLLALHLPIVGIDVVLGAVVVAVDRQRLWMVLSAVGCVFNPLANLFAIPYATRTFDNGAIGAAFATLLTEMVVLGGALLIIPRGILSRYTLSLGWRIFLASAAMIPVLLALDSTPLYIRIMLGIIVYAMMSLALKTTSISEVRQLLTSFRNRGGPHETNDVPADAQR